MLCNFKIASPTESERLLVLKFKYEEGHIKSTHKINHQSASTSVLTGNVVSEENEY